jgi:hypothetical protein
MRRKNSATRPLSWIKDSTAQEIGEAILAVDTEKAVRVVAYLISVLGPEVHDRIELLRFDLQSNPGEVFAGALLGGVRSLLGTKSKK